MGAFAKAQGGGGKVFETLVKEGLSLQKKTQNLAEEKISEVTGRMTAMAGSVTARAGENWDKLESIFEARTAKAMNKLGVPTAKDLDALAQRVDELAAAVARLSKNKAQAQAQAPAEAQPPRSKPRRAAAKSADAVARAAGGAGGAGGGAAAAGPAGGKKRRAGA
jgi:poly(hydroxyalkanoate) granule-associated protein